MGAEIILKRKKFFLLLLNKSAGIPVRRTGGENKAGKMERDRQKKRPALVERGKMWSHNSYLQ